MLVSLAYAQDAGAPAVEAPSAFAGMLPLLLIFIVFYFLLIRPQQTRLKEHQKLINAIRRGDKVLTGGGIIGSVVKIDGEETLHVEIAQGVVVKVARSTIANVITHGTPAANDPGIPDSKKKSKGDKPVANDNAGEG